MNRTTRQPGGSGRVTERVWQVASGEEGRQTGAVGPNHADTWGEGRKQVTARPDRQTDMAQGTRRGGVGWGTRTGSWGDTQAGSTQTKTWQGCGLDPTMQAVVGASAAPLGVPGVPVAPQSPVGQGLQGPAITAEALEDLGWRILAQEPQRVHLPGKGQGKAGAGNGAVTALTARCRPGSWRPGGRGSAQPHPPDPGAVLLEATPYRLTGGFT